jgi:lantibiotic modifying enzyme
MSSDRGFLEAAASIGRQLVADAIWQDGRCNWVGARHDTARPWTAEYRPLEPNIYDGTAGVGLFLAHLYSVTGDRDARMTAAGALTQSLARVPAMAPGRRDGFHAGSPGIAWAAARGAALLDEERLLAGAAVAARVPRPASPDRRPDVNPGLAGTALGLLALDDDGLLGEAVRAGELLLNQATATRHGWTWRNPDRRHRHQLCGLSHGAAGIGWALLELFDASGDERFREAATGAFEYERQWLDTRTGTWPDLRLGGQGRGEPPRASSDVGSWCHGAGGIALTRLRAFAVLGAEQYRDEAELALATTRRALAEEDVGEIRDFSLCHGAAGTAEVLRLGDLGAGSPGLGQAVLTLYPELHDLPCGAAAGTTPALFRGLSGIAWWFLRLHDDTVPSPLTMPIERLTPARLQA